MLRGRIKNATDFLLKTLRDLRHPPRIPERLRTEHVAPPPIIYLDLSTRGTSEPANAIENEFRELIHSLDVDCETPGCRMCYGTRLSN